MAAMIEAVGLSKRFGSRPVFDSLDFEVERGQRLALLGLNGAGKTTLLRCVMGVLSFEGTIRVYLWDARKDSPTLGNRMTLTVGKDNPVMLLVPPGVVVSRTKERLD